jgi:perosamine synthetase
MNNIIPVYQPALLGNEKEYVTKCLETNWISSRGSFVSQFEDEFSKFIGVGHSTTVSNGTVALHLALLALGIGPGDEVIVPTLTYIASVNAISYVGATPIFVDSEEGSWNIDTSKIKKKISVKTKAILAVHLYGAPCDMQTIVKICDENRLFLIEDAAEAFGTMYKGKYVGSFGDISTFSFFGNKTITTGEGGMLTSNNKAIIERAAYLKSQAVSTTREYWHDEIGYNFRMTNICAAIGLAQLEYANDILFKKGNLAKWYREDLASTSLEFQEEKEDEINSYWMVSILANNIEERDSIRVHLKNNGIETRPLFYPAHKMPVFSSKESFIIAESLSSRGLNLPSYPDLTREQITFITSKIIEVL